MSECLFCHIASGKVPSEKVFETPTVLGFKDINPQAKTHLLFIHKGHSQDICNLIDSQPSQALELLSAIKEYCQKEGLDKKGFRLVTNNGALAGQTVFHTHFHVLAGEKLGRFGN